MRTYFATLVMFYVVNFSSQFLCKVDHFFPILARGLLPKFLEKALHGSSHEIKKKSFLNINMGESFQDYS